MKRQSAELPCPWWLSEYDAASVGDKILINSSGNLQLNQSQEQESFYTANIIRNSLTAAEMSSSVCNTLPSCSTLNSQYQTPKKRQRIYEHPKPLESTNEVSVQSFNWKKAITKLQSCCGPSEFELTVLLTEDKWDTTTENAFWMYKYVDRNGQEFAFTRNTSLLFEQLYKENSNLNLTLKMRLPETGREHLISLKTMEMTDLLTGEKIALVRIINAKVNKTPALGFGSSPFPAQWADQHDDIAVFTLGVSSDEYITIKERFLRTMPNSCILRIERIQNKKLYIRYAFQKAMILDKNFGNEQNVNEKLLFHGTSATPPSTIWRSQDGFDLRYCRKGMWGIGTYFAENASYSDKYAYRLDKNKRDFSEMFVAHVLTGNSIEMKSSRARKLTRPPVCVAATSGAPEVLYDSVTGCSEGSRIYVVYKLDMAYPSYLVRYCERDQ